MSSCADPPGPGASDVFWLVAPCRVRHTRPRCRPDWSGCVAVSHCSSAFSCWSLHIELFEIATQTRQALARLDIAGKQLAHDRAFGCFYPHPCPIARMIGI